MKKVLFHEKQMFPKLIAGLIMGFTVAILVFSLFMVEKDEPESIPWLVVVYLFCLLPVAIPFFVGIEIKITEDGIYYKALPFNRKPRFLPKDQIVVTYKEASPFKKMGRYGMKTSGYAKYFLIGKHNLHIQHGKRSIMIGTQKPRELQRVLEAFKGLTV